MMRRSVLRFNARPGYRIHSTLDSAIHTPTSWTTIPPPPLRGPAETWREMDTSFVDLNEIDDIPSTIETASPEEQNTSKANNGGMLSANEVMSTSSWGKQEDLKMLYNPLHQLKLQQASKPLRYLCQEIAELLKEYVTLDREHASYRMTRDDIHAPRYEWTDYQLTPRRLYFSGRTLFLKYRRQIFSRPKEASSASVVPLLMQYEVLNWFIMAQKLAQHDSFTQHRSFDHRPASDYQILDVRGDVEALVTNIFEQEEANRRMKNDEKASSFFFINSGHSSDDDEVNVGFHRLQSVASMCREFGVPLQGNLPRKADRDGNDPKDEETVGSSTLEVLVDIFAAAAAQSGGGKKGPKSFSSVYPSTALSIAATIPILDLQMSDPQTGKILTTTAHNGNNHRKWKAVALLSRWMHQGDLENFDADDCALLLQFYLNLKRMNPAVDFSTSTEGTSTSEDKGTMEGCEAPLLPLYHFVQLTVQRVRFLLYNKGPDRSVYSDRNKIPLVDFFEITKQPHQRKDVVNWRSHYIQVAEGIRQIKMGPRSTSRLLQALQDISKEFTIMNSTTTTTTPTGKKNKKEMMKIFSFDTLMKDLLDHVNFKAMTDNKRVMRPSDAAYILHSTLSQLHHLNLLDSAEGREKKQKILSFVDMNISVNANHITDPKLIAKYFEGFAKAKWVPASLSKLEMAALRLMASPSLGLSDIASLLDSLAQLQQSVTFRQSTSSGPLLVEACIKKLEEHLYQPTVTATNESEEARSSFPNKPSSSTATSFQMMSGTNMFSHHHDLQRKDGGVQQNLTKIKSNTRGEEDIHGTVSSSVDVVFHILSTLFALVSSTSGSHPESVHQSVYVSIEGRLISILTAICEEFILEASALWNETEKNGRRADNDKEEHDKMKMNSKGKNYKNKNKKKTKAMNIMEKKFKERMLKNMDTSSSIFDQKVQNILHRVMRQHSSKNRNQYDGEAKGTDDVRSVVVLSQLQKLLTVEQQNLPAVSSSSTNKQQNSFSTLAKKFIPNNPSMQNKRRSSTSSSGLLLSLTDLLHRPSLLHSFLILLHQGGQLLQRKKTTTTTTEQVLHGLSALLFLATAAKEEKAMFNMDGEGHSGGGRLLHFTHHQYPFSQSIQLGQCLWNSYQVFTSTINASLMHKKEEAIFGRNRRKLSKKINNEETKEVATTKELIENCWQHEFFSQCSLKLTQEMFRQFQRLQPSPVPREEEEDGSEEGQLQLTLERICSALETVLRLQTLRLTKATKEINMEAPTMSKMSTLGESSFGKKDGEQPTLSGKESCQTWIQWCAYAMQEGCHQLKEKLLQLRRKQNIKGNKDKDDGGRIRQERWEQQQFLLRERVKSEKDMTNAYSFVQPVKPLYARPSRSLQKNIKIESDDVTGKKNKTEDLSMASSSSHGSSGGTDFYQLQQTAMKLLRMIYTNSSMHQSGEEVEERQSLVNTKMMQPLAEACTQFLLAFILILEEVTAHSSTSGGDGQQSATIAQEGNNTSHFYSQMGLLDINDDTDNDDFVSRMMGERIPGRNNHHKGMVGEASYLDELDQGRRLSETVLQIKDCLERTGMMGYAEKIFPEIDVGVE